MPQSDKKTFLGKLARFVSNPTTNWAALEGGEKHPDLPSDPAAAAQGGVAVLTQAELLHIQRQRRKRNRRIREKKFAMLRQIQAGVSIPGAHADLSSALLADAALPSRSSSALRARKAHLSTDKFDVNWIDKVEQQMTNQWWNQEGGRPEEVAKATAQNDVCAGESAQKTQLMTYGPLDLFQQVDAVQDEVIPFEPVSFASFDPVEPLEPVQQGDFRPMRDSAHANGTGENVDLPDAQQPDMIQFVYENPPSQLQGDFHKDHSKSQPDAQQPGVDSEVYIPLSIEDAYLMAESDELDATIEKLKADGAESAAYVAASVERLPEELNEPAILFAQNRDDEARNQLRVLVDASIAQAKENKKVEPDALLALLDLYRATRQEDEFENASIELVQKFERSAPQYRGADRAQATRIFSSFGVHTEVQEHEQASWCTPAKLGLNDVMLLRSQLVARKPLQVLLDWRPLLTILEDAIEPLLDQFRDLAGRKVEVLMWGGEHLLACCERQLETAAKPANMLLWLLRLEVARLMYGQEEFDALALEYCVALEQSPPSWVQPRCQFVNADTVVTMSAYEDIDLNARSQQTGKLGNINYPHQWQGDLIGSIQPLLKSLDAENATGQCVIDCRQLDRMDYTASAELLNWLIIQDTSSQREVRFIHVHRLLAVFWRVVGVTNKARVDLRQD